MRALMSLLGITIFSWLTETYPVTAQSPEKELPIRFYRFEENYNYLKEVKNKTLLEKLKYLRLRNQAYLSLGGEIRSAFLLENNPGWNTAIKNNDYVRLRLMLHANGQVSDNFRVFVQWLHANTPGNEQRSLPPDQDALAIPQLFAEYTFSLQDKGSRSFLRIGRQELNLGDHKLLQVREGLNARRTFDAARFQGNAGTHRVDAFYARPVSIRDGVLDNSVLNDETEFWGLNYARFNSDKTVRADVFYFGYTRQDATFQQGEGYEARTTLGARINWKKKPWDVDGEVSYQFGDFASTSISAWAFTVVAGYTWQNLRARPQLTLMMSYTSGDQQADDHRLNSFNPLFPRGNYFGGTAIVSGVNIIDPGMALELFPAQQHRFRTAWNLLWRTSTEDGLYNPPNIFFQSGEESDQRYIGSQLTVGYYVTVSPLLSVSVAYAHLFTGPLVQDLITPQDVDLLLAQVQFKF